MSALDCQRCGACCFSPLERYVRLAGDDHARLLPEEQARLTFFHGNRCYMRMVPTGLEEPPSDFAPARPLLRCAALDARDGVYRCTVYERRPQVCRDLERGGPACDHDRARRADRTALA